MNDKQDIYSFAESTVGVSSADSCDATMTGAKKKAISSYLTKLGPAMRQKYGKQKYYAPEQIRETALQQALSIDYVCWAYVLFASTSDFERIHSAAGEACDYAMMHQLVGDSFFHGQSMFDVSVVVDAIAAGASGAVETASDAAGMLTDFDWSSLIDWS